jgi:hypothetical protein
MHIPDFQNGLLEKAGASMTVQQTHRHPSQVHL